MSENIVNRKDLAFLTNVLGVELFSFTIYAAFDKAFHGGFLNDFVVFSMFSSAVLRSLVSCFAIPSVNTLHTPIGTIAIFCR